MSVVEGGKGRFCEDFEVGDVYRHPLGPSVTTADNIWFTLLTQNTAPVHFDHHYASQTESGEPLMDSTFTVALVTARALPTSRYVRSGSPGCVRGGIVTVGTTGYQDIGLPSNPPGEPETASHIRPMIPVQGVREAYYAHS